MKQYLKPKSKIEFFSLTDYTTISLEIKRVIFSLTYGFVADTHEHKDRDVNENEFFHLIN